MHSSVEPVNSERDLRLECELLRLQALADSLAIVAGDSGSTSTDVRLDRAIALIDVLAAELRRAHFRIFGGQ